MTTAVLTHLTTAAEHACSTPDLASWLATLEATIHADRGDHTAARQALQRAHATLPTDSSHPSSPPDRMSVILAAATGHVLLQAGDHTSARDTLTTALDQLHPTARRHRVLVLVDLATAQRPLSSKALHALDEHLSRIAA